MHPLGHITLACGTVWLGSRVFARTSEQSATPAPAADYAPSSAQTRWGSSTLGRGVEKIDYRLVAVGGLLPDLMDKSVGWLLLRNVYGGNGPSHPRPANALGAATRQPFPGGDAP